MDGFKQKQIQRRKSNAKKIFLRAKASDHLFAAQSLGVPICVSGNGIFFQAIGFMEPVVCPDGMQMETVSERQSNRDGIYTLTKVFCVGSHQEADITWKVFLFMFGFPALGVIAFLIAPSCSAEKEKIILNPDGDRGAWYV